MQKKKKKKGENKIQREKSRFRNSICIPKEIEQKPEWPKEQQIQCS